MTEGLDDALDKLMSKVSGAELEEPTLKDPRPEKPESSSPFKEEPKRSPNEVDNHRTATVAPTNENTHAQLEKRLTNDNLNEDQQDFVNLVDQYYQMHGVLLNRDIAVRELYFNGDEFDDLLSNAAVVEALKERGVLSRPGMLIKGKKTDGVSEPEQIEPDTSWKAGVLSPLQMIVANTMLDFVDTRSQKKRLQDLQVSTQLYQKWLADDTFSNYMKNVAERMIGNNMHEAQMALLDKVRAGDMTAIKYMHEMTGRFVETKGSTTGGAPVGDVKNLLVRILEILSEEIEDPETLVRISERFQNMTNHQAQAQAMVASMEDTIVMPEVAQQRVLTPKLQAMLEGGNPND